MKTAIAAVIISSLSLIVAAISCLITIKNYRKSKRLEFFQRRDLLSQKISELNVENSQAHLISARYEMVIQKFTHLRATGEEAERIKNQITSIKKLQEGIEERTKFHDEGIDEAHDLCKELKLGDDIERVEKIIALTQRVIDNAKRSNEISLGSLHILENIEPLMKADLDKLQQFEMQLAELDSISERLLKASG